MFLFLKLIFFQKKMFLDKELNLEGKCGQEEIEKKKFSQKDYPNLVELNLRSNGLRKLPPNIFNELKQLKGLCLNECICNCVCIISGGVDKLGL